MSSHHQTQAESNFPLPEFVDGNSSFTFKQHSYNNYATVKRPPKLYVKPHHDVSNLNNDSFAQLISFKEGTLEPSCTPLSSSVYQPELLQSYFEQAFTIISKIGEGSFGEVFKVRSKENGQLFAVKVSKQFYRGRYHRKERLQEVKRYIQLSKNEHCITLYKAWEEDDRLYMQMELCQGSLEAFVASKRGLPETFIWNILVDLLLGLKALHDNNLIHLDVKLDNILIDDDCTCKLGDFGLVVDVTRENLENATEGDSRYVAPELLEDRFSKAADIFSLGITILELACNLELPKNGPLWNELRHGILPKECIALMSNELGQIIQSMMDPEPSKRPDVNTLLQYSRIQNLLAERKKWILIKRFKKFTNRLTGKIFQFMCNLKNQFIVPFLTIWSIFSSSNRTVSIPTKTPLAPPPITIDSLLLLDDSTEMMLENSPNKLINTPMDFRLNSTPLSQHGSFRRMRKEFNRQHLSPGFNVDDDFDRKSLLTNNKSSPRFTLPSLCLSNGNKTHDYSSLPGKRLVFSSDDSP